MRQPSISDRVYRMFYPNVVAGDPQDLQDFGNTFLVPELESAINRFYGSVYVDRRSRRPGIDYNDHAWRQRLCQPPFQYHKELFRIFDYLRLSPRDINDICDWWGTKTEVDAWEKSHPGRVVAEDDVWDNIPRIRMISTPMAIYHDGHFTTLQAAVTPQIPSQRRRSSRIRRFFSRPRAITSFRDLHHYPSAESRRELPASRGSSNGLSSSRSSHEQAISGRATNSPTDDETVLEDSVGVSLNRHLHAGIRNSEFEDWLKEEAENGRLPSSNTNRAQFGSQPPNTISYSTSHPTMSGHSYSRRMNGFPTATAAAATGSSPVYQGDLHTLPVAVSATSEPAQRNSPTTRQSSLTRYRTTPYYHNYRPIRPRPARNSS